MEDAAKLVSKVLVLDDIPECGERINAFCDAHNLVAVKAQSRKVMAVLKSNVDLGAVFLSETYGNGSNSGLALAQKIHAVRPELPIFLRLEPGKPPQTLATSDSGAYIAPYAIDQLDMLASAISSSIFSQAYPNSLVRGITELTMTALDSQFIDTDIISGAPYVVRDRIIYGELFTLIPLESNWCRGYMMLQTEENGLIAMVHAGKTPLETNEANFRDINNVLGEITNLVWGAFKNRFIAQETSGAGLTQVPIIVNHLHRYISFGSDDPQLCFKYTLQDRSGVLPPLVIYQRFAFNLKWSPEKFKENEALVEDLLKSGELELF
jgi:hypothetical protein